MLSVLQCGEHMFVPRNVACIQIIKPALFKQALTRATVRNSYAAAAQHYLVMIGHNGKKIALTETKNTLPFTLLNYFLLIALFCIF